MDKVKVAKEVGKFVVNCGTSMLLGGLGGLATATFKVGLQQTVAKICIPAAASIWANVLKKHSDPVVEETIDNAAKALSLGKEIGANVVDKIVED